MLKSKHGWSGKYRWEKDNCWSNEKWDFNALHSTSWGPTVHGLSLVEGAAFAKVSGASLAGYVGVEGTSTPWKLVLRDSAGIATVGYIGAADAAEALDAELVGNPGFETAGAGETDVFGTWGETTTWGTSVILRDTAVYNGGAASAKLTRGDTQIRVFQSFSVTVGKLYKLTFATRGDGTYAGQYRVYDNDGAANIIAIETTGVTAASWTTVTRYFTAPVGCSSAQIGFYTPVTPTGFAHFDDVSIKEVTHVGATGTHIVSAKNGSTRNWASIGTGFNYNGTKYRAEIRRA
jgi:hypothetical protein